MKYVIVLGDGMADEPIESLGGKTPLAFAKTEAMDELSKEGYGYCPSLQYRDHIR